MRQFRLSDRLHFSRRAHAPPGTPEGRALARILNQLAREVDALPGPDDVEDIIPPALRCYARPIPSAGLRVCYRLTATEVWVIAVKRLDA